MKLQVEIINKYGNDLIYPICDKSKLLAKLTGNKTFTRDNIAIVKALGYELELVSTAKI